ncbi:MAG: DUF1330 domain-containing protein [Actinomycetota bacterium]|nr:DUF1330 domain-containing protein [Actinomycetota bacterium]
MPAYVTAQLVIHDPVGYARYVERFAETLAPFDAELLAADDAPEVVEGSWPHDKFVLIRFGDRDEARRWADSPAYREIAADRQVATTTTSVLVRGIGGSPR